MISSRFMRVEINAARSTPRILLFNYLLERFCWRNIITRVGLLSRTHYISICWPAGLLRIVPGWQTSHNEYCIYCTDCKTCIGRRLNALLWFHWQPNGLSLFQAQRDDLSRNDVKLTDKLCLYLYLLFNRFISNLNNKFLYRLSE